MDLEFSNSSLAKKMELEFLNSSLDLEFLQ